MNIAKNGLPFISVVVPIFNEEKYIKQSLSALIDQDYPSDSFELIIVDDGSTDLSPQICREFVEQNMGYLPKIRYVRIKHSGLSVGRNTGIYLSKGTLIAFIDGDAVAERDWLRRLQEPFVDPNVGVVGGKIKILNSESNVARFLDVVRYHQSFGPKEYRGYVVGTNMMYRKAVFEQVGGFFENFTSRGDEVALLRKLLWHYDFAVAPGAIVYHERPETLVRWLRIEYLDGLLAPLIDKVPSSQVTFGKNCLIQIERILITFLPFWLLLVLLFRGKYRLFGLGGILVSGLALMRKHLTKQNSYEIRQRLKQELGFPFGGVIYLFVDWLSTSVKTTGWLRGLWVHRSASLSSAIPHGDRIEQVLSNFPLG